MALDKVVDSAMLDAGMKSVADAIRAKAGTTDLLAWPDGFKAAVDGIQTGGGGGSTSDAVMKDVNFYDYDGTLVASYTLAEAKALTTLPDVPTHDGLTFQGWNWSLEKIHALTRPMNVGAMYITDDGKTRIYIRLEEGRTSPMLGVCPNGTVTVDWGDGTTPDILTGTSTTTVKWTPNHAYAAPGEYVIKLTVDGTMGFYGDSSSSGGSAILRYSSSNDNRNYAYRNSIEQIELGSSVTSIADNAFYSCYSLSLITIANGVTRIADSAFQGCNSLTSITIANGVTRIASNAFRSCYSLASITIANGVTSIADSAFNGCNSLTSITIPNSVTRIASSAFQGCNSLTSITIPNGVTSIADSAFRFCNSLASITIANGVTSIADSAFNGCYSLTSITIPNSVTRIASNAFRFCYSVAFYDFSNHTSVPTLANTNAFTNIPADCQIRVPASLVDAWKTATNWSTYANYIVGV